MEKYDGPDRRAIPRQKSFMLGRIYFNHRRSTADCLIRDFTKDGALLEFPETVGVPDAFEVYVPAKDQYFQAQVIRRKQDSIGIAWAAEDLMHPTCETHHTADPLADRVAKLEHEVALLKKRLCLVQD